MPTTPKINALSLRSESSSRGGLPPLYAHLEDLRRRADEFLRHSGEPQAKAGSSGGDSTDPFDDPLVARGLALIRDLSDATRQVDMKLDCELVELERQDPALAASLRTIKESG